MCVQALLLVLPEVMHQDKATTVALPSGAHVRASTLALTSMLSPFCKNTGCMGVSAADPAMLTHHV